MRKRLVSILFVIIITFLPSCSLGGSIRVFQIWDDVLDHDQIRPVSVPVVIKTDAMELIIEDSEIHEIEGNNYSVAQISLPETYTESLYIQEDDDLTTFVLINRHHVQSRISDISNTLLTADLTISKDADIANDSDIFYFDVTLPNTYNYVTTAGSTGSTDSPIPLRNGESATISEIPVGTPYTVTELPDPRYLSSSSKNAGIIQSTDNEVLFTNNLITTTFWVTKQWQGTAHDKITLHLFADGEEVDAAFEKDGDVYFASSLPKYAADGHEILYSATEDYWQEYITMYMNVGSYSNRTKAIYNGGTIVNKQVTSFSVRKEWVGVSPENQPEITFQLYQNGKPIVWRQPEYKNGVYIWENLPAMKDGELASYYVLENPIDGYETSYRNLGSIEDQRALNGGIITNYKIPKTGDHENPLMLAGIIALSIAGILIVMLRKRR